MNVDIYAQGKALLKKAEKEASHVQISISNPFSQSLELVDNKPDSFISTNETVYAVYVHLGKKAGMSVSNIFDLNLVDRAIAVAKASAEQDYFYGLPEKKQFKKVELYDKKVANLSEDDMIDMANQLIGSFSPKPKMNVSLSTGSIIKEISTDLTLTSEGVENPEESTALASVAECVSRKAGKVSSGSDYKDSRQLFDISDFGTRLAEKTNDFLSAKKLNEKFETVILKPEPFSDLLDNAFLPNLNGKNVEKNKSLFVNKLGQKMISSIVSIYDDSLVPFGQNSEAVDKEGTPCQKTELFKNGILKNFIYDYNTAKHAGKVSTGNAGLSSIDFSNVVVEGEYQEVENALIVDSVIGAHTADDLSTDFSVTVDRGYIMKDGEKKPIKGFMISGKMIDALQKAVSIGKEIEIRNGIYTGALATKGVNVILE